MTKENIKKRINSTYNITGVAGEYFVAAELSRHGWLAAMTIKNTPSVDIMATSPDGNRRINIQVKTRSIKNRQGWIMGEGIEKILEGENYIAFVDLKGLDERPDYFLIPRNIFARWTTERHKKWKETPGRNGKMHGHSSIRTFDKPQFEEFSKYYNNWEI